MCKAGIKLYGSVIFLLASLSVLAQKTDKVFLKNGDVITGAIKSMKFAKLTIDMDGPGKIQVKWVYIVKIKSDKIFQITTRQGEVVVTKLDSIFFNEQQATLVDVVEIVQIKDKFLKRLDGDINLGFNYAKSNGIVQFNFSSALTYRQPKLETNLRLNSVISDNSTDTVRSKKQDATIDIYRVLNRRYYINGLLGWQQNTELGLDNRLLASVMGGKIILNNNRRRFLAGAGLSYNVEDSRGGSGVTNNLEGLVGVQYKEFRHTTPKISVDSKFLLYPSITDAGRIRMDLQFTSKFEIFKDFNVGLTFYDNFDNRPPAGASSKNDFGVNFTVGFEFGK